MELLLTLTLRKGEVQSVMRFFVAEKVSMHKIHRHLCVIYGTNVMPAHKVWFRLRNSRVVT